jgi:hypothetical protein
MSLERLSLSLKELLSGNDGNSTAWLVKKVPLLMRAIEDANGIHELSGSEKKKLLITVICDYINEEEDPYDHAALYFAQSVLPQLIDTLVAVDTNKIRIKARRCIDSCCTIV